MLIYTVLSFLQSFYLVNITHTTKKKKKDRPLLVNLARCIRNLFYIRNDLSLSLKGPWPFVHRQHDQVFTTNFHLIRISLSLFIRLFLEDIAKNKGRRPNRSGFFHFLLPARAIIRNCLQRRFAIFDSILNRHPGKISSDRMLARIKIRCWTIFYSSNSFYLFRSRNCNRFFYLFIYLFVPLFFIIRCICFCFSSFWRAFVL